MITIPNNYGNASQIPNISCFSTKLIYAISSDYPLPAAYSCWSKGDKKGHEVVRSQPPTCYKEVKEHISDTGEV